MQTAIIIVNYKTSSLVVRCLNSLLSLLKDKTYMVIIVDNNSQDNSSEKINLFIKNCKFKACIQYIELSVNGGFSYGNNQAIKKALLKYPELNFFWLLNPDTYLTDGFVPDFLDFFEKNSKIGILGTQIISANTNKTESAAFNKLVPFSEFLLGARCGPLFRLFPKQMPSFTPSEKSIQCDWVSGASFIVRKEVFDSIGFMDEDFFLYYEEIDFCLRAKKAGWEIWHNPEIKIYHEDKSTTGIHVTETRRPAFWYNSRRRYYQKHFGLLGLVLADFGWFVGRLTLLTRHYLGLRANLANDPKCFMYDLLIGDIKAIFQQIIGKNHD